MRHALFALPLLAALPAAAQERIQSNCIALAQGPERVMPASFRHPVPLDSVRISYVNHAMFLIQTPTVSAATDFTGFLGNVDFLPDVVTMNHAHGTHWTEFPDPAIPHVLKGWAEGDVAADYRLDLGEMLVRNVPTDIRGRFGGVERDGNSVFVFEAGGLCIGHLGHLHHEPTPEDFALIGRLDVVMVPVDGGLTIDHPTLVRALDRFRARIVIPMHWFGRGTLESFLSDMETEAGYAVERRTESAMTLTLADLPDRPMVVVLEPQLLSED
ncbi:MBL fold metallo-hydrolase [Rubellimicrobium aerolatum]|uniref:MBL fold metallo-hydrolase n=1 Tax=Rubellimicrobium aerolatum TaxID=490979 RepID=A0ABW0SFG3_9RHOB|nr:MBL fold metallo-hydrolase [Rubellimicrobium aerolatum]MBP1807163.1 L-ascorbate metabolism protein UlaG (beta-lactamase superfamily) [Rubellimicrobium aerolatum]